MMMFSQTHSSIWWTNPCLGGFGGWLDVGVNGILTQQLTSVLRWVFIYEKGYQSTDMAVSSVFSKMKGVGYTNVNGTERVWDVADYVFPSQVGDVNWPTTLRHMPPSNCRSLSAPNSLIVNLGHIQCTWIQPSEGRNVHLGWQISLSRITYIDSTLRAVWQW